jgi:hypothetical protein
MQEGVSSLTQSLQDFDNYCKENETKEATKKPPSISMEVFTIITTIAIVQNTPAK